MFAVTVKAYRQELDKYKRIPTDTYLILRRLRRSKASHRPYTTGFYFGKPTRMIISIRRQYIRNYDFIALVLVMIMKETWLWWNSAIRSG